MELGTAESQVSMTVHDYETVPFDDDSDCEVSSHSQFKIFTENGMMRLEEGIERNDDVERTEHSIIKKCFFVGMGLSGIMKDVNVVAVHKNMYSSPVGRAKMEAFKIFSQAVGNKRGGDANIKYAWYGGSCNEIYEIVAHGFSGRDRILENGSCHGFGLHLSPVNVPIDSVFRAVEDENGVRHMLLCRVILGSSELVPAGSQQFQPSSSNFDSGIDNPFSPTKYIIWNAYMNTHIAPNYIISFRAPSLTGSCLIGNRVSPSTRLPILLNAISKFMHPSKMDLIMKHYNDFRIKKIGRSHLIRRLRSLVGDKLLLAVMKLCEDKRV